jgi:hypothetical protein
MKSRLSLLTILLGASAMFSVLRAQQSLFIQSVIRTPGTNSMGVYVMVNGFQFPTNNLGFVDVIMGSIPLTPNSYSVMYHGNMMSIQIQNLPACINSKTITVLYNNSNVEPAINAVGYNEYSDVSTIKEQIVKSYNLCSDNSALMEVSYSSGKAPYMFINSSTKDTIFNVQENQLISVNVKSNHAIKVVDANSCALLTKLSYLTADLIPKTPVITESEATVCKGSIDQKYTVNGTANSKNTYKWFDKDTLLISEGSSSLLSDLCAGKYFVRYYAEINNPNCPIKSSTLKALVVPEKTVTSLNAQLQTTLNAYVSNNKLIFDEEIQYSNAQLLVYDTQGVVYIQQALNAEVSLNELKSGMYIYRLENESGVYTGKFMR